MSETEGMTLEQTIHHWVERGAADANRTEALLGKFVHERGWDIEDAALGFATEAARQCARAATSLERHAIAHLAMLFFAASLERFDPAAVPVSLSVLLADAGPTDHDPKREQYLDQVCRYLRTAMREDPAKMS